MWIVRANEHDTGRVLAYLSCGTENKAARAACYLWEHYSGVDVTTEWESEL